MATWYDPFRATISGSGSICPRPEGGYQALIHAADGRIYAGKGETRDEAIQALARAIARGIEVSQC